MSFSHLFFKSTFAIYLSLVFARLEAALQIVVMVKRSLYKLCFILGQFFKQVNKK